MDTNGHESGSFRDDGRRRESEPEERVESKQGASPRRASWFLTTHWSVVLAAGASDAPTRARAALETLCRTYWYPLYAYLRRTGLSPHDAEDTVQGFFLECIEKPFVAAADRGKGRFRSYLLLALKRFLNHQREKARAAKRGGGRAHVFLDALDAEQRYALEPADRLSADRLYERRWAMTLLDTVLGRLRTEQAGRDREAEFEVLKDCLTGGRGEASHAELAARLNRSEGAVKVAVHRLRRRYRELLEEEIAQTVSAPEDIADERRHLLAALGG